MTDPIERKLHSAAPVIAIEAAAGCGKTTTAARFAGQAAESLDSGRVLLLSHTHAACGEFQRKSALERKIDVETCDSFCLKIIRAYAAALRLPAPLESHLDRPNGVAFSELSKKACELFNRAPTVARAIAACYPLIVTDEHQDASLSQHECLQLLREIGGARLRIFGDPMQAIHPPRSDEYIDWSVVWAAADERGALETPHRWSDATELGGWIQDCRLRLKSGNPIDLHRAPRDVSIRLYSDLAGRHRFKDNRAASRLVHSFLDASPKNAVALSFLAAMARSTAQIAAWRAPLNEGATLEELDRLITACEDRNGCVDALVSAFIDFVKTIGTGLSEVEGSALTRRCGSTMDEHGAGAKQVQWLAILREVYASPDHRGVSAAMRRLINSPPHGYAIRLHDHASAVSAFWRTDDPRSFRRMLGRLRRKAPPPRQLVSTIHKAKGLEFDHVLLCPVDQHQYPTGAYGAKLLYVALSRAKRSITVAIESKATTTHVELPRSAAAGGTVAC